MKNLYPLLLVLLFMSFKQTLAQSAEVRAKEVERVLSYLASDELGGRDTGSKGLEMAAKFIEEEFKAAGVLPFFETYRDTFEAKGMSTFNIVGVVEGNDEQLKNEYVLVGAHVDHIGKGNEVNGDHIANGANDNAAGSTAVIELAKSMANSKNNKRSVIFVLFGAEEVGLLGSYHLAKVLKDKGLDLYVMINFEMIGVPLQNAPHKSYITGFDKSNMASKINEYAGSSLVGFLPKAKEFQLFSRSDNYPFFKKFRVPCQTVSTFDFTNYEYYHHVDDESSELDFKFMADLINGYRPVILKMTNTSEKEIKLN